MQELVAVSLQVMELLLSLLHSPPHRVSIGHMLKLMIPWSFNLLEPAVPLNFTPLALYILSTFLPPCLYYLHCLAAHVLKGDDSDKLFKFLKAAAPSWGKIANELNFSYDEKTAITHTPGLNGDEDYFQALLHRWLKREPHLTTVEVLANALRLAGEHKLAYDLKHSSDFMS